MPNRWCGTLLLTLLVAGCTAPTDNMEEFRTCPVESLPDCATDGQAIGPLASLPDVSVCLSRIDDRAYQLHEMLWEPTGTLWYGYNRDEREAPGHGYLRVAQGDRTAAFTWQERDGLLQALPLTFDYDPTSALGYVALAIHYEDVHGPATEGRAHDPTFFWSGKSNVDPLPGDPFLPFGVQVIHRLAGSDDSLYFGPSDAAETNYVSWSGDGVFLLQIQSRIGSYVSAAALPHQPATCFT